jgi:hypothetical protein
MISKIKNYILLFLLIITLISGGFGFYFYKHSKNMERQRDNANDRMDVLLNDVTTYKNKNGELVMKTLEYERYVGDLENSNDSLERTIYKTIQASNIREKNLKEAYAILLSSHNGGLVHRDTTVIHDTINNTVITNSTLTYDDNFLKLTIINDSLDYTYNELITLLKASRRVDRKFIIWRWINWKKTIDRNMVEIKSNNPNSSFDGRIIKIN